MARVTMIGEVTKITRTNGKVFAQVTLQIPANKAGDVPMGEVSISLEPTQSAIDDLLPRGGRGR